MGSEAEHKIGVEQKATKCSKTLLICTCRAVTLSSTCEKKKPAS